MKKYILSSLLATSSLLAAPHAVAGIVAFPEAQGWGRWALGARASASPTVYHVTNLNDSGSGSLRDAVSQPNRIVVFDVSGVIRISSRIQFAKNLYVAGQSAPGEGITVYGDGVSFSGADNLICRYMRFRMGHGGSSGKDCAGIAHGSHMIFDHCSFSWGLDETFSINPDGKGSIGNYTLSNCIIGQGLMTHSAGGLMQADSITLYRNLYIDNNTRNNKVKGINQYANNVVYNWNNGCYIMGGDSEGKSFVNIQSNLFINGPAGGGNCFTGANADFHCYGSDNWQDRNKDGILNPSLVTDYSACTRESQPYPYPALELYAGNELIEKLIPIVGASLPYRDQSDCYMIDELMSFGTAGELISNEGSLPIGTPDSWSWFAGSRLQDSDNDGMPDAWEEANGTNKNANDACQKSSNGYLNIENYLNGISVESRQYFLRQPITLSATSTTTTMTLSWRDYTFAEEGFAIETKTNGTWSEVARTSANATSHTLTDLPSGSAIEVRVRAFGNDGGSEKYSAYTQGTFKTRPVEVGVVDIDSYEPDLLNPSDDELAATTAETHLQYHIDDEQSLVLNHNLPLHSFVMTGKGQLTISGTGAITGQASVNKGDAGTLVLNNKNSYTGATVLHDGTLEFNSIANGGTASAIGSSQEFAQNWIMDGGTYRYTGGNATTNRSARLSRPTVLSVKSGSTLTMTGSIEGYGDSDHDFIVDGGGQITVASGSFFGYDGATILQGGTLFLSTVEITKQGIGNSSKLVLAGGKLATKGETSNYETYTLPIESRENTYSYLALNRNCYFRSSITGAGTIEWQIPYVREYFDPNLTGFTGKIVAKGLGSDETLFMSEKNFEMPQTRVELKNKARMCMWATNGTGQVGGLSGDAGTSLSGCSKQTNTSVCKWIIGGANSDETFRGVIDNRCCNGSYKSKTVDITKTGTGLWRLTGNNSYVGTTIVEGGTLIVNGTHSGGGTYIVKDGATLKGSGTISNSSISINSGGILSAGDTIVSNKTLTLTGTTSLKSGSAVEIPIRFDYLAFSNPLAVGTLVINSNVVLRVGLTGNESLPANSFVKVFASFNKITGSFSAIEPATPGEGLVWDDSQLYTSGKLYVRNDESAIDTIHDDDSASQSLIFDLTGKPVEEPLSGQTYIIGRRIIHIR